MITKVMVCFDGSDHALSALLNAADLAQKYRATLDVATVMHIDMNAIAVGGSAVMIPIHEEEAKANAAAILQNAAKLVQEAGYAAPATNILRGTPAEAILEHARLTNADLIVAGRRGYGTLRGMLVGSVSQKLIAHATCPVLIT
ncbi:universal stress protein [Loktanella salsilacus]|uniref:universal stress protein n=1 Tax=Loktanella salsilacus TaxID=195913 RepID=UPI003735440B